MPFTQDPEFGPTIYRLIKEHGVSTIVETGTCKGVATREFAMMGPEVYSCEINPLHYNDATKNLMDYNNVHLFLASSQNFLSEHMSKFKDRVLFFLDAHDMYEPDFRHEYWPILDELRTIQEHKPEAIIVVHDFEVPGYKFRCQVDRFSGHRLNWDYIKDVIVIDYKKLYNTGPGSINRLLQYPNDTSGTLYLIPRSIYVG